ncbi:TetR/AcrR family transcriptional regulator [Saccharopolyspora sp. 5N708]|uniref:TetR/AcrR family transcriptional regulator n=1 Tax=Saccharopolyspora sp. 5N708 TaxID=3457424 RepID=UPI003FCF57C0
MPDIKHFDPDVALERVERLFWERGMETASIQEITAATGLNRSSLYATFGDKRELYLAALRRYLSHHAQPAFRELARDDRGIPAIQDFFAGLIDVRCSGEYAGWGCMVVNAQVSGERNDPAVRAKLDEHDQWLHEALRTALESARRRGQLPADTSTDAAADALVLLAYGVNLRSRAGAGPGTLHRAVAEVLASFAAERAAPE